MAQSMGQGGNTCKGGGEAEDSNEGGEVEGDGGQVGRVEGDGGGHPLPETEPLWHMAQSKQHR